MKLATHCTATRLGLACATILAAATLVPGARAEEWSKSYTISGRAQVRVDTNDGAQNRSSFVLFTRATS